MPQEELPLARQQQGRPRRHVIRSYPGQVAPQADKLDALLAPVIVEPVSIDEPRCVVVGVPEDCSNPFLLMCSDHPLDVRTPLRMLANVVGNGANGFVTRHIRATDTLDLFSDDVLSVLGVEEQVVIFFPFVVSVLWVAPNASKINVRRLASKRH
jgi:hypothetical protein